MKKQSHDSSAKRTWNNTRNTLLTHGSSVVLLLASSTNVFVENRQPLLHCDVLLVCQWAIFTKCSPVFCSLWLIWIYYAESTESKSNGGRDQVNESRWKKERKCCTVCANHLKSGNIMQWNKIINGNNLISIGRDLDYNVSDVSSWIWPTWRGRHRGHVTCAPLLNKSSLTVNASVLLISGVKSTQFLYLIKSY